MNAHTPTASTARSATPRDQALGARLRIFRANAGISQQDLAAALGVTYQQIQKYECGTNRLSVTRLMDAAAALGHPVTDFLEGLDAETDRIGGGDARLQDFIHSETGIRLIKAASRLDATGQRAVTNTANAIADAKAIWEGGEA